MKLRRSVAIHRTGSVMFEGGSNELACRLGRVDIADARLRVPLQFAKCYADALTVGHTNTLVAAHQRCERDGFRRGEGRIPPGAVFDAGDFLAVLVLVGPCRLVLNELRAVFRMLAFAQSSEFFDSNGTAQSPLQGKPSLPLAMHLRVTAPVVLLLRDKLARMVSPCLPSRQWFGNGQHAIQLRNERGNISLLFVDLD